MQIEQSILLLRGHRVLLDSTLASLYGVQTKVLVQAVKRNRERFPSDFLLELNKQEVADLRSQIVTSSWGGRRYAPFAFTEQGVAMLSSAFHGVLFLTSLVMSRFARVTPGFRSDDNLNLAVEQRHFVPPVVRRRVYPRCARPTN